MKNLFKESKIIFLAANLNQGNSSESSNDNSTESTTEDSTESATDTSNELVTEDSPESTDSMEDTASSGLIEENIETPFLKEELERQKEKIQEEIQELKSKIKDILEQEGIYTKGLIQEIGKINYQLNESKTRLLTIIITAENTNQSLQDKINQFEDEVSKIDLRKTELAVEKNKALKKQIEEKKAPMEISSTTVQLVQEPYLKLW